MIVGKIYGNSVAVGANAVVAPLSFCLVVLLLSPTIMSITTTIISMIMVTKAFNTIKSDDRQLKVSQAVPGISLEHPPAQTVQVVAESGDDESS